MKPAMRMKWIVRSALALVAAFAMAGTVWAVSVSPLAIYINGRERSAVLTLYNDGTRPEEIQINFAFGYPRSDSLGNLTVALADTAPTGEPSALGWINAFPRRVILQPGERQAVRILVEPPAGLAEGEYWSRILIKSKGGQPPIEQRRDDGITVRIDVETTIAIPASFRLGQVNTGIAITNASAAVRGDTVISTVDVARSGNAAYLGSMTVEVLDARGAVLGTHQEHLGVYHDLRRMSAISVPSIAGAASVRVTIESKREDLPPEGPLPAATVTRTFAISR